MGARLIKLRIFVHSDSVDGIRDVLRRDLQTRNIELPVVSILGVSGFPDSTQLVQLESTIEFRTPRAMQGIAFLAGLAAPTGARVIAGLAGVAAEGGVARDSIERVSCFAEIDNHFDETRAAVAKTFPRASLTFVRSYAKAAQPLIECEGVGILAETTVPDARIVNMRAVAPSPNFSHAALVSTPRLVFTGGAIAGPGLESQRDVIDRMSRAVSSLGPGMQDVMMSDNYWLTDSARNHLRIARTEAYHGVIPAATGVFFTSLEGGNTSSLELVIASGRAHVDTVTIAPGSALVDGRYLQSHTAELVQTVTRGTQTTSVNHFRVVKRALNEGGRDQYLLDIKAMSAYTDSLQHFEITLDRTTTALVHRRDSDSSGVRSIAEINGGHASGSLRPPGASALSPFAFDLSEPAFSNAFLDAAMNAVTLRQGLVVRIPAYGFGPTQRQVEWHTFTVVGRDTVRSGSTLMTGWRIEEAPGSGPPARRMWLVREPPYFPLDITYRADLSTLRTTQSLISTP